MLIPSVFRHRAFTFMWSSRLVMTIATMIQSVAIGWSVYTIARESYSEHKSMFLVGMVGLVQFVPMFLLALLAGETADRYDRRKILLCCGLLQTVCAAAFTLIAVQPHVSLYLIFIVAGFYGIARAFGMPAGTSLVPSLVPGEMLSRAIAWNTLSVQGGVILGPWIGGVLCGIAPSLANGTAFCLYLIGTVLCFCLVKTPVRITPKSEGASRLTLIREGVTHLWQSKIVLGAISLDLFAVLLGGVTALLPAYAKDVLFIGPEGFGHLRAAFGLGAGLTTLMLAFSPLKRHAGRWMLGGVMLYGVATLVFSLSRNVPLSLIALAVSGAADSISVFTRQNLVQIVTPDAMRGRVSAVSSLFISASNELGEFESGLAARFLGIVGAAVFGSMGSIGVTCLWAKIFPELRKADHLDPKHAPKAA